MQAIKDAVKWFGGHACCSQKSGHSFQKANGSFAVCFVFLAHNLDCTELADQLVTLQSTIEKARRKITFVPFLWDDQNPSLRKEALLLARLSGGFVVSPKCEVDEFPYRLIQSSSIIARMIREPNGNLYGDEDVRFEEFLEGKYLEARASVSDGIEPKKLVSEHAKRIVSHIENRMEVVPLPGQPFPCCDDLLVGGSQNEGHMEAVSEPLCDSYVDDLANKCKEQAAEIEQLKLRSEALSVEISTLRAQSTDQIAKLGEDVDTLKRDSKDKEFKIEQMRMAMLRQDAQTKEVQKLNAKLNEQSSTFEEQLQKMQILINKMQETTAAQKKRSPRGKRGGNKATSQRGLEEVASENEQGTGSQEADGSWSIPETYDSWK